MEIIDIIAVVLLLICGFLGFRRGFIREIIETVGAIAAALITYRFHPFLAESFGINDSSGFLAKMSVVIGLFVAVMVVLSIIGHLLRRFIMAIHLGMYDRLLGFILGALKGAIIIAVIAVGLIWIGQPGAKVVSNSKIIRADLMVLDILSGVMPDKIQSKYAEAVSGFREKQTSKSEKYMSILNLPSSLLDSLTLAGKNLALNEIIEDIRHRDLPDTTYLPGEITVWDAINQRGFVICSLGNNSKEYPLYYGSFQDNSLIGDITAKTRIKCRIAFIAFLNEICAVDVVPDTVGTND